MSRRCRPGIRARIRNGSDRGKIVLVVRYYFGEILDGATWPDAVFPWVVTSLGPPLASHWIRGGKQCLPSMTVVVDDCDLDPLGDDDDAFDLEVGVDAGKGLVRPRATDKV